MLNATGLDGVLEFLLFLLLSLFGGWDAYFVIDSFPREVSRVVSFSVPREISSLHYRGLGSLLTVVCLFGRIAVFVFGCWVRCSRAIQRPLLS